MKKSLLFKTALFAYVMLSSFTLLAQVDSSLVVSGIKIVSEIAVIVAPKYSGVVVAITGLASSLATIILAFLHKRKTLRKWRKEGKLKD